MELRTPTNQTDVYTRIENPCGQCGAPIFMPEWTEYLRGNRLRYLWGCESCGYKFETLVCFPEA